MSRRLRPDAGSPFRTATAFMADRHSQRTPAVPHTELANTVIVPTGLVGVEVNSFPWGDRVQNGQLQDYNAKKFNVPAWPNGWSVLDFDETHQYSDYLSVLDRNNGTADLIVDVVAPGAGEHLWIYLESLKPIPDAALRPSQLRAETGRRRISQRPGGNLYGRLLAIAP